VSTTGIDGILERQDLALVFDATSANAHVQNAPLLSAAGKCVIDLTPAAVGPYVVPTVNLDQHLGAENLNLVSSGGQATIPFVHAVARVARVEYAEIVATIASASAGPGTRQNIDEFTETTARGLETVGGAEEGKAIIILNPADPPILMRDTIYARVVEPAPVDDIRRSVVEMAEEVRSFVPGLRLRLCEFVDFQVTIMVEIEGAGDYLPRYAGNLDIMTAAATRVGQTVARQIAPEI
jgi:acetaldehyde dehydrogenase